MSASDVTTRAPHASTGGADSDSTTAILEVRGLAVQYHTRHQSVEAVRGIDLGLTAGHTLALVGESGSGKSTTAHAIAALLPHVARVTSGTILLEGEDLLGKSEKELRRLRGAAIGVVPQDPTVSLNPVMRIDDQVGEVLRIHDLAEGEAARARVVRALADAGIDRPELRAEQYPHELSGGMRQRVLIAAALIARPGLLIADEPTSALDVTVQRQILDHVDALTRDIGTAVLLVTHDLGVAADRADHLAVMSGGRIVETGTPDEVLGSPQEPYTRSLIASAPSLRTRGNVVGWSPTSQRTDVAVRAMPQRGAAGEHILQRGAADELAGADVVLRATDLDKDFAVPASPAAPDGVLHAVCGVSLQVARRRTLALVGESGSGKSTTARLLLRLAQLTSGRIEFDGRDITNVSGGELRQLRRQLQVVQQNPYATLNPRMTIGQVVMDPLHSQRIGTRRERRRRVMELLDLVGLPTSYVERRPAELSGGQRQRVAIARALAVRPEVVVLDEPVSALDVQVQAQVLDLLARLQRELGVSYVFISHDLAVVGQVAHTIGVMRGGHLLEVGEAEQVLTHPRHEYTAELLDAIPGRASPARRT